MPALPLTAPALLTLPPTGSDVPGWLWSGDFWSNLFSLDTTPLVEKVVRTVLVYALILVVVRLAGKRTLAQWNSFDLVVVLLLSNVVQNAVIGPDTSFLGGAIGAVVLVAFNSAMDRLGFLNARTERLLEGTATTLVHDGRYDEATLRRLGLRRHELARALHLQGADRIDQVEVARLEPGGTFTVRLKAEAQSATVEDLRRAVADLQAHLDARLDALGAPPVDGAPDRP
ncbi:DUF421 domain-containing protein [Lapillicoccus jejuensis]|uniref:Uncharacterized membrane protein YcaP (DUF421 family) n=1 Tax=Lapillicoccus jejuensis TaxID=402171 RepID=A0A542DVN7_9MICO|nr:YetF domain-containing protein [Lapillicoccus jejuensis]TQJ07157.1 uncharacterized membrane protein YcaP (DUF421 family) [Lapillicoccus jejuensis]